MELFILRHAIAAEPGPAYPDDSRRPLTPKGIKKMREIAEGMKAMKIDFKFILSSPYLRAKETAQITADVFKVKKYKIRFTDNLIPARPFHLLADEIRNLERNILLVGHEPYLSGFISYLLIGSGWIPMILKKGGLCHLTAEKFTGEGSAVLCGFWAPSQVRLLI